MGAVGSGQVDTVAGAKVEASHGRVGDREGGRGTTITAIAQPEGVLRRSPKKEVAGHEEATEICSEIAQNIECGGHEAFSWAHTESIDWAQHSVDVSLLHHMMLCTTYDVV